jgi:hypothetical protein
VRAADKRLISNPFENEEKKRKARRKGTQSTNSISEELSAEDKSKR